MIDDACPPEPTAEQCSASSSIAYAGSSGQTILGFAIWYPQMGGYASKAVVVPSWNKQDQDAADQCFDVFVWHDADFPFNTQNLNPGEEPRYPRPFAFHHCRAAQFIKFGQTVQRRMREMSIDA